MGSTLRKENSKFCLVVRNRMVTVIVHFRIMMVC